MMKKPSQVIVLSQVKMTGELFKKLLEREGIKAMSLENYGDFAHFLNDLNEDMLLVDLKLTKKEDFEEKLKQEMAKAFMSLHLVFFGTSDEWEKTAWAKELGDFLMAPVEINQVALKIQEIFSSKM